MLWWHVVSHMVTVVLVVLKEPTISLLYKKKVTTASSHMVVTVWNLHGVTNQNTTIYIFTM
jgi:hypothetical protein